jgi:LPXTG-motif cell wall-anchored protein
MKSLKRVFQSLAFLGSAGLLMAQGTPVQRTTKLNISEPTEIAGTILEPGSYMIRVHDVTNGKVQVQVTDETQTKVFATVTAMRMRRNLDTNQQQTDQTEFTYTSVNGHPALSTWFYPGDEWGEQFASGKATWIAQSDAGTVTQTRTETKATEVATAPAPAPTPAPARVVENNPPAPEPAEVAPAPMTRTAPAQLPRTGSSLPLLGLIGLGALGTAAALHIGRRLA